MPAPHGGPPGDVLITVSIAPHPLFKVDGQNLRLDLPITLYEAVLGAKVRVPTLDGAVELAVPPNTSSGRTFRLKGKGLPGKTAGRPLRHDQDRAARRQGCRPRRADEALARDEAVRSAQRDGVIARHRDDEADMDDLARRAYSKLAQIPGRARRC